MAAEDSNRGFTLVELIVALVVLSVLLAIAVPSLMGHIERAREERFVLEAQDVRRATERYLIEQYPKGEVNLMELLNAANSSEICPEGVFFATPKYLKMQTSFPKVAAGNSSFLHVSPA